MLTIAFALAVVQPEPTVVQGRLTPPAEDRLPSRIQRRTVRVERTDRFAAHILHSFAYCLVRNRPELSASLLETPAESPEQAHVMRQLVPPFSNCLRARQMRVDNILLRGAIAEALLRRELRPAAIGPAPAAGSGITSWGRCATRIDPAEVARILESAPGSRSELDALAAFERAAAPCRPAAGTPVDPLRMRGALGEAYYLYRRGVL